MAAPQTTLNGAINNSVTAVTVHDVLGFATSAETDDLIQIDSEYMLVTAGMGTTSWTVTRAYAGSTAASHLDNATVTRLERAYTDASRLQVMSKAPTADYSFLRDCASQANSWMIGEVGRFFGPSTDTSRIYDVLRMDSTLEIAGGLRTMTKVEMKLQTSDPSYIDVTADVYKRPLSWDLVNGLEADKITFSDRPTLGYRYFYAGYAMVKVTGAFGPITPPDALRRIADTVGWSLYQSRADGGGGMTGGDPIAMTINRVLTGADLSTIDLYRGVGPSLYAMPAF
jgi:hypothetical protein